MPYRFESEGIADLMEQIRQLEGKAGMVAAASLYEGAAVMARAINESAKSIRTAEFHYAGPGEKRLPSPDEKEMLLSSGAMGIARFRKNLDSVDTSVGYNSSGYAPVKWNHMSSRARTNYKAATFKGRDITASSTLKWIRDQGGSEKYGLSKNIGKGAQNLKPIGVVANSINSGTSFMDKQPFMRKALRAAKQKCEAAIIKKAESLLDAILKEKDIGGKTA